LSQRDGGFVWSRCDGQTSITEIAEKLAAKTNQPVNEDIVWLALELLKKEDLISGDILTDTNFKGMSRREMIRVSAGVAASALGFSVDANLDGTVCAAVAACVRI
jgi:hypothetical protein